MIGRRGTPIFGSLPGVRLADGRIVVANGGSGELRYYDATGRHLSSAGGQGGGPGEFGSLGNILRLPGDSILGVWKDELDVERIRLHRVSKPHA